MRGFSIGAAVMAGFRLIGREPLAFLAWSLIYAVLGIGPQVLGMARGFAAMGRLSGASSVEAVSATMASLQQFQLVSFLTGIVAAMLLYSAAYRAILFPDDRRFLYLRLGGREAWLTLNGLVLAVMFFIGALVAVIPFAVIIGVASAAGSAGAGAAGLIAIPVILLAFGVLLWLSARLFLALPMGFAERNFRIPEAWRMTRDFAGGVFVVFLALFAIVILAEFLLVGVGAGVVSLFIPLADLGKAFTGNPAQLLGSVNPAAWVVIAAVWAMFATAGGVLFNAALAEIYRALSGPDTSSVFD